MVKLSDIAPINVATSGGSANIEVNAGARLRSIKFTYNNASADIITYFELKWVNSPVPLRFVPNTFSAAGGTHAGGSISVNCMVPLDVVVQNATTVTIIAYGTGSFTAYACLEWEV